MASNIKNFKCLIHFNETKRGSILSEDLTYSMLHEMVMQKFNLEANAEINFSFKLSSFDFAVDITDDAEVQFFVGCACNSKDEFAQLFVSERKNDQKNMFFNFFESTTLENEGPSNPEITSSHLNNSYNNTSFLNNGISFDLGQNDFHINDSLQLQNEPHFSNPESSFAFRSNEYNTDDVVNENPQKKFHKWQKFMSFEPDIPEKPVYKAKPNISKQYTQQSEVEKGNIFDKKDALILAVRLKALNEGSPGRVLVTPGSVRVICQGQAGQTLGIILTVEVALIDGTLLLAEIVLEGETAPAVSKNYMVILAPPTGQGPDMDITLMTGTALESKSKRRKPTDEEDLAVPWSCEEAAAQVDAGNAYVVSYVQFITLIGTGESMVLMSSRPQKAYTDTMGISKRPFYHISNCKAKEVQSTDPVEITISIRWMERTSRIFMRRFQG
ncbi:hypothetical protein Tco_0217958 [Tanacetum coccineum]